MNIVAELFIEKYFQNLLVQFKKKKKQKSANLFFVCCDKFERKYLITNLSTVFSMND